MEYQVLVEFDPETQHFTATVPGIPNIIVDAKTERTSLKMARDAISMYVQEAGRTSGRRRRRGPAPMRAKVVTVNV